MSKKNSDSLLEKYLAGETTLAEEEKFFSDKTQGPGIEEWSRYVKQKRKKAPPNFNDTVWASIQIRHRRKQRFLVGLSGLAASITLFIAISIVNTNDNDVSYEEKKALLNEALSMFSDKKSEPAKQSIIYEDDMVIIYKTSK